MRGFRPSRRGGLVAALLAALVAGGAPADEVNRSEPFRSTTDHRFGDVEHWTGVFDDPKRDEWQKPDEVVRALGVREGMRVADVGAGTGYFARHLARAVGPSGAVFVVEVEQGFVAKLRDRAEQEGTANVIPVFGSFDNPRLPPGAMDVVLFVDTYHHVDHRLEYFRNLQRALTPGGRVAVIDFLKKPLPVGPKPPHKIAESVVVEEMQAAGYRLVERPEILPYQYFLIFAPAEAAQSDATPAPD